MVVRKKLTLFFVFLPIVLSAYHPADTNTDGVLTIEEATAYVRAWTQGESWVTGPDPIPEAYAEQAAMLWRTGERYRRQDGAPLPSAWVPDPHDADFVAMDSHRAEPLDMVRLFGLPDSGEWSARFTVEGEYGEFRAFIDRDASDNLVLIVPINPYDLAGGGRLHFEISNETGESWFAGPLLLQPLPAAPGSTEALYDHFLALLEHHETIIGVDLDNYQSLPASDVPPVLGPLVVLSRMLSDADNPNALANLIDGTAAGSNGQGIDLDLADRVIGKLGLQDLLREPEDEISVALMQVAESVFHPSVFGSEKRAVSNTGHLSVLMRAQKQAEEAVSGLGSKVRDAAGSGFDAISTIDDALTYAGSSRSIRGAGAAGVLSTVYSTWKFFQQYDAGTLPSRFEEIRFVIEPPPNGPLVEDACGDGDQLRVIPEVRVSSTGFSYKDVIDFTDSVNVFPFGLPKPGIDQIQEAIGHKAIDLLEIDVPSHEWAWFRVSSPVYSEMEDTAGVLSSTGYEDTTTAIKFKPEKAGVADLMVRVLPDPFGGRTITGSATQEVLSLEIEIQEGPRSIRPGQSGTFFAILENGRDRSEDAIDWRVSDGVITGKEKVGERWRLEWTAPPGRSRFPVQITAFSSSQECARARPDAEPREHTVNVYAEGFDIVPDMICMVSGETEFFRVESEEGELPDGITWSIRSGGGELVPIDSHQAAYTATGGGEAVTIRAEDFEDPENYAEHTFRIDCSGIMSWGLDAETFPPREGVYQTRTGSFVQASADETGGMPDPDFALGGEQTSGTFFMAADLLVSFDEVVEDESTGTGSVTGSFHGAGLYFSGNAEEVLALYDDTHNHRTYTVQPGKLPHEYVLEAQVDTYFLDEEAGKTIDLVEETEGTTFRIGLEGNGKFGGQQPPGAEITDYQWELSTGDAGSGKRVVFELPRSIGTFWAKLKVTDNYGNTATQLRHIRTIRFDGTFDFDYNLNGDMFVCSSLAFPFLNPSFDDFPDFSFGPCGSVDFLVQGSVDGSFSAGSAAVYAGLMETGMGEQFVISFSH